MCKAHCLSCVGMCPYEKARSVLLNIYYQANSTLVSEMELCLLKGGKGMGLLEDDCDLMDVAVSVGLDLGDALLACGHH